MKDSHNFRKVVISLDLLFCEMAFFHLCPFRLEQIVSTNKMIIFRTIWAPVISLTVLELISQN